MLSSQKIPPILTTSAWIASDPIRGIFPDSPVAREGLWDVPTTALFSEATPQAKKGLTRVLTDQFSTIDSNRANGHEFSKKTEETESRGASPRVLANVPKNKLQEVDLILKRCDSVARRSKAYEALARSKTIE